MADNRQSLKDIYNQLQKMNGVLCNLGTAGPTADYETQLLCNPANNNIVIAIVTITAGVPTTVYYNLDGTAYIGGTPVRCPDSNLESDPVEGCAGGATFFQWVVKDAGQPNGVVYYTDASGALVPAPGGFTIGSCNAEIATEQLCLCDDNGGVITQFIRFYSYDPNTNTITFLGDWLPDLSAQYTPTGTVALCDTIGTPLQLVARRTHLTGITNWNMPGNVVSFTILVRRIGDAINPATITDNAAAVTPLFVGDQLTYGIPNDSHTIIQGTFSVNLTHALDMVTINYLELV